jgi:hypothetical protein
MSLLQGMERGCAGETRRGMNKSNRQTGGRKPLRPEFFLPHFPALHFAALQLSP